MKCSPRKLAVLGLALGLLGSGPVRADKTSWYQVDLIVFEQLQPAGLATERWTPGADAPAGLDEAIELREPGQGVIPPFRPGGEPNPVPYRRLQDDVAQLTAVRRSLERAAHMEPIIHLSWRQPIGEKAYARPIRIRGGQAYMVADLDLGRGGEAAWTPERPQPAPAWARPTTLSQIQWQPDIELVPALDGTIVLWKGRYLHIETDLVHTRPMPASVRQPTPPLPLADADRTPPDELLRVRLQAHRRMRSDELHYIDHPGFGVIVRVTPYELPDDEEQADTASSPDGEQPLAR